jgi:Phage capsid family.
MTNIIGKMLVNNQRVSDLVILMSETVALNLSSKRTSLGARLFPDINVTGGNYNGIPIITSQSVGARVILLNPTQILLAEDPTVNIDISEEASVVMTTTPASSPAATSLVSFWQNNLIGLRVDQFITWKRALTAAVEYISNAVYSGTT